MWLKFTRSCLASRSPSVPRAHPRCASHFIKPVLLREAAVMAVTLVADDRRDALNYWWTTTHSCPPAFHRRPELCLRPDKDCGRRRPPPPRPRHRLPSLTGNMVKRMVLAQSRALPKLLSTNHPLPARANHALKEGAVRILPATATIVLEFDGFLRRLMWLVLPSWGLLKLAAHGPESHHFSV